MSSSPEVSPSPAQEKSKDCQVNHAEESAPHCTGVTGAFYNQQGSGNGGRTRSGNKVYVNKRMDVDRLADIPLSSVDMIDDISCCRQFSTKRGLGIHLFHCKNKRVFNEVPADPSVVKPCLVSIVDCRSFSHLPDIEEAF